jgi:predicted nucleic acid-binding protein
MKYALDTNAYTDLARGDAGLARQIRGGLEVFLPFIVLAELRSGFAVGSQSPINE